MPPRWPMALVCTRPALLQPRIAWASRPRAKPNQGPAGPRWERPKPQGPNGRSGAALAGLELVGHGLGGPGEPAIHHSRAPSGLSIWHNSFAVGPEPPPAGLLMAARQGLREAAPSGSPILRRGDFFAGPLGCRWKQWDFQHQSLLFGLE
jgi:hypothetical protein